MTAKRLAYFAKLAITTPLLIAGILVALVELSFRRKGTVSMWIASPFLRVADGGGSKGDAKVDPNPVHLVVRVEGCIPQWRTAMLEQPLTLGELDIYKPDSLWVLPDQWTSSHLQYERRDEGVWWYRLSTKSLGAFSWVLHVDHGLLFVKDAREDADGVGVTVQGEQGEAMSLCLDGRDEGRTWYRVQNPARWRFA